MLKPSYKYYIILVGLLGVLNLNGQNMAGVSGNYMQGFILPEHDLLTRIDQGLYQGGEVSFLNKSEYKSYWQEIYNQPQYGVSFFFTDFGEPNVLGRSIGGEYFFKINLVQGNRAGVSLRSGFGINYINKIYDEQDNWLNGSMGSHINARFNLRLTAQLRLSKHIWFNTGAGLDHFSNANTRYPNKGINAIAFYAGLSYQLKEETAVQEPFEIPQLESRWRSHATAFLGFFHTKWPNNTYYLNPNLSYDLTYQLGHVFSLSAGVDGFYDRSAKDRFEGVVGYTDVNPISAGVHLSQNIHYNRFSFSMQEGWYVYIDEQLGKKNLYNRVIFNWDISDKFGLNIFGHSYLNDLDYVGTGIRYYVF